MESLALKLDLNKFKRLCSAFTPDIAVMVRGRHAIGKTEAVRQVASLVRDDFYKDPENCARMVKALSSHKEVARKIAATGGVWTYEMGVPIIEMRLSQMQEGDIVGLPFLEGKGTEFRPVTWLLNCEEFPVVLFLDELNRASRQVEQATFQLADSKAFYGHTLHKGTRIYVAVNIGDAYTVEDMDPAAISRYAVVDLDPTKEEWLNYIKSFVHPLTYAFLKTNPQYIEYLGEIEPNTKTNDRRAWVRLDEQLQVNNLFSEPSDLLLHMSSSMLGFTTGNAFYEFVKTADTLSGEDVIVNWKKLKSQLPADEEQKMKQLMLYTIKVQNMFSNKLISTERFIEISEKFKTFVEEIPGEMLAGIYSSASDEYTNIFVNIAGKMVARAFNGTPAKTSETQKTTPPLIPRIRR